MVHTPTKKKVPTGNKRGRPRATEVIAKTNHKVDNFFKRKPAQSDAKMPLVNQEEEKKQEEARGESSGIHRHKQQPPALLCAVAR